MAEEMVKDVDVTQNGGDPKETDNASEVAKTESEEQKEWTLDEILKNPKLQAEYDRRLKKAQDTREKNIRSQFEQEAAEKERLAKMDAEEQAKYQREQLEKERDELRLQLNRERLGKFAASTLSKKGIEANDDVLGFVIGKDEDETTANIESFMQVVQKQVELLELKRNTGKAPRQYTNENTDPMDEFQKHLAKYE